VSSTVPIGAICFLWCVVMAVAPIRRPRSLAVFSWICGAIPNELPFVALFVVIVSNVPIGSRFPPGGWAALAVNVVAVVGLVVIVARAACAGRRLDRALDDALGEGWRAAIDPALDGARRRHLPWLQILLMPWPIRGRDVERVANISYGDNGTSNLLDVYRNRWHPTGAPVLVHLHGGRFRWGRKSRESRALLHRLASRGWTCVSANYHLSRTPAAGFPEHLVDVKRVIAWVRRDGGDFGADPDTIFLSGSSAGAHLTAMAALTANDARFQPGFEAADTSIAAGIGLYGYYGELGGDERPPSTPLAYLGSDAPPFFVVHGANDTYTPVEGARVLAERMRASSSSPVVYAVLPGAQHSFDLFHSIRFESVIDAIEGFGAWVRTRRGATAN